MKHSRFRVNQPVLGTRTHVKINFDAFFEFLRVFLQAFTSFRGQNSAQFWLALRKVVTRHDEWDATPTMEKHVFLYAAERHKHITSEALTRINKGSLMELLRTD